eukprot:917208-Pleurochrysis_carterae.AAC.1
MTPLPLEYGNDFDFDTTTFIMNPPPPLAKGRVRGCVFGAGSFPGLDMALLECCAVCGTVRRCAMRAAVPPFGGKREAPRPQCYISISHDLQGEPPGLI